MPGVLELLGLVFGGAARLGQHWMELKDKDKEREHERLMFDKQVELGKQKFENDAALRRMDADAAKDASDAEALITAIRDQTTAASAAGGWVASVSAVIRPLLTVWHAVVMYTAVKIAMFALAYSGGLSWASALTSIYTEFDRALCGSIVSFWFADRSLRKVK